MFDQIDEKKDPGHFLSAQKIPRSIPEKPTRQSEDCVTMQKDDFPEASETRAWRVTQ
jgi:hypothetical protein